MARLVRGEVSTATGWDRLSIGIDGLATTTFFMND
jgi:hypothetical protein